MMVMYLSFSHTIALPLLKIVALVYSEPIFFGIFSAVYISHRLASFFTRNIPFLTTVGWFLNSCENSTSPSVVIIPHFPLSVSIKGNAVT